MTPLHTQILTARDRNGQELRTIQKQLQKLIIGTFFKIAGSRKCISCSDLTSSLVVQDKVHLSKTGGGYFLFLSPNGNLKGSFIRCANQK